MTNLTVTNALYRDLCQLRQREATLGDLVRVHWSPLFPIKLKDGSIIHGYMIGSGGGIVWLVEDKKIGL